MARIDEKGNFIEDGISTYTTIDSEGNLQHIPMPTRKKKKKENEWFDTGAFDDGYDFGDVTKTILGTAVNIPVNIAKGAADLGKGIGHLGAAGVAQIADWAGNDEWANQIRENISGKNEKYNELEKNLTLPGLLTQAQEATSKDSVLAKNTESILQGAGNYAGMAAAQVVGVPWQLTAGLSSAGSELSNAYANGAEDWEAWTSAAGNAAFEILSEYISGGAKLPGTGKTMEKLSGSLVDSIKNKYIKGLAGFGINMLGEGIEENVSGIASEMLRKLTYMKDDEKNLLANAFQGATDYLSQEALNDFIGGAVVSGLTMGVSPGTYQNIKTGRNLVSGLTSNEQKTIDDLVDKRYNEVIENGEKASKSKIEEQVKSDLEKGYIDLEEIEKTLGGDTYTQYQEAQKKYDELQSKIDELLDSKDLTERQKRELTSLESERDNLNLDGLKNDLRSYVNDLTQNDTLLRNSYNEYANKGQAYNIDLSQIDDKYRDTYQRAIDSGVLNNTNRSHDFVDLLAKLENEKGVKFNFTNNDKLKNSQFALEGKDINGYVDGDTITLNMDSNEALNQVVGHEITHILEGTDLYDALSNSVKEYVESTGKSYKDLIDATKEKYTDKNGNLIGNADIVKELNADLVGKYLFTDEEFIKRISTQNRNLFQKIYDEIKYLSKLITSGSKEGRQLEKLKHTFEKAYRQTTVNQRTGIQYSIAGINSINNLSDSKFKQDALSAYSEAQKLANQNVDNEKIRQQTKWFQDKNGDWKFELDDSKVVLDNNLIKKNGEYDLSDVIQHNILYKLYPQLANYKVKFTDMKSNGSFNNESKLIRINNKFIENADYAELKGTLLHEVQHAIQQLENFEGGTNTKLSRKAYYNKLGEIEADDTKQRYLKGYDKETREKIAPESSKENPKHSRYDTYMKDRKLVDKVKDSIYDIFNRGENNAKENQEVDMDSQNEDKGLVDGRRLLNGELDNSSFSLEERVSGDELLDAQDLIDEVKSVGGMVDDNGYVTLYHQTTNENAQKIKETGKMSGKENGIFFSTSKSASQADGRGTTKLEFKIPAEKLILDDLFDDNADLKINSRPGEQIDISNYLVDNNIKYSISEDNQGRKLSKQQQEYFKDSKVRDENGNLRVLYNGSGNHTEYLPGYMSDESIWGKGIYLTPYKNIAEMYGNDVKEAYVNIKNPLTPGKSITFEQYNDLYKAINEGEEAYHEEYDMYDDDMDLLWNITNKGQWADYADDIIKYTGKDGIIVEPMDGDESDQMIIAFKSNQVKNVDNTTPTDNSDIRYSISNQNEDIAPVGNYNIKGEDIKLQDIAPIETKQETKETTKPKAKLPIEPTKEEAYENKPTRHETIQKNRQLAAEYLNNMNSWKDTPLFKQKINTMKRNLRDIMPKSEADTLYNEYFAPISKNNATIERETKKYNNIIEKLNLNKNESTAVQLLGELKYNPETTLTKEEVYDFINKHKLNETKLDNAVNTFRNVYDDLFGRVNKVLEDNGYEPIGYKKGYFPHFTEEHGKNILGKLAEKLGWQFNSQKLPTDIAGLTDTFTPGKKWVSFAQHRTGDVTDYNALKGFDNYIRGAMQVIHHTNDIQKLRGLENEIRYQYSEKGVKEKLEKIFNNNELNTEEKQNQIDTLLQGYNSGLGNFVMNLREYTNNLAGKKSALDRSVEFTMGRNIYNTMNNISSRVSANMVGLNLSSALTNFIPITQAWSQVSTKNMLRAMKQTISNQVRSDGFVDKSDYLTNRINSADKLYKTGLEKVSDKASVLFDAIDSFSSQVIVRGKYLDNIQKGMSESEALNNANEFAKDVMAGRSQGDKPTIFNSTSPITKLFTAFQLEVNNQYGYMFKDLPNDLKDKGMGLLIGAFIKMFLGAWLYNKMSEELTGRKSAFSPVDIVADSVKTMQREDLDEYSKISSIAKDISDESPFISGLLGGGRLPISSAIPDIPTLTENIINLKDEEKKDKAIKGIQKELEKPLFYVAMPFGGGQLKKTKDAISMYNEGLPVAGSYTDSGNLRFTADETPEGKLKAFLFGQYSSKEAQEYVESGYKSIPSKKIQELKDLDMSASEYRKYSNDLKSAGTTNADKIDFISNSNYTDKQKNIMAKNVLNKDIDMKKYKNYGSYEEADYAINNPEKYLLSKVTSNTFNGYKNYVKDLNSIKADKDSNGKSISNSRKNKVLDYINNLNEDYGSKLILYKMEYPSDNSYNSEIVDYLNNKDNITLNEEKKILSYLGMTVTDDGSVRWSK